jgi:hypothetical protein
VTLPGQNFYAVWRERFVGTKLLPDENISPSERLRQAIRRHQRLRRDQFKTTGGKIVRVFRPGFRSVEGGPDFHGAVLQFENEMPVSGDVEIDLRSSGWRAHGHDRNENFQNVLLRVVWDEPTSASNENAPLILPLKNRLDAPLAELSLWLENESPSALPENLRGEINLVNLAVNPVAR